MAFAGLTPNSTSKFCHGRATPANLSDPFLVDWVWDPEPLYCGTPTNGIKPFDAPTSAWRTTLGQWMYQDGIGGVYVSDDGKVWRGAQGKFLGGMVTDFFPLPRTCDGCGSGTDPSAPLLSPAPATSIASGGPTHVHEAANMYSLVVLTPGTKKDEAGNLTVVTDGGATVANASGLGLVPRCDHGTYGFPKTFWDPVKGRRLQYGWVMGGKFEGEEDGTLLGVDGRNLTRKANHQSLLREVTYDPRLGMLYFTPVEELRQLRGSILAQVATPTTIPAALGPRAVGGVLPLPVPPLWANQSEVRVVFAVPTKAAVFGVRVLAKLDDCVHPPCKPVPRDMLSPGMSFSVAFTPAPVRPGAAQGSGDDGAMGGAAATTAWNITVGEGVDRSTHMPAGHGTGSMPMLSTDTQIEIVLYVDQVVVEAYFAGGR